LRSATVYFTKRPICWAMSEPTERIPQHKHCVQCGRAYVGEGRYCSDACKESKANELKKTKRNLTYIWLIAVAVMVVVIIYSL
jgi:predicted nucleic acid-binding Zn ribbon protein